jgi:tRNA(Arg) A34 adenosine deaminase TadA
MTTNVEHERWMQRCIALAEEARARGDLPVGTLIVRGGQLLA